MSEHYNGLTPAEAERLAWLAEECGEVIQAVTKILRHGYNSYDPTKPNHKGNRADLVREIGDLQKVIHFMEVKRDIEMPIPFDLNVSAKYLHHNSAATFYTHPSYPDEVGEDK